MSAPADYAEIVEPVVVEVETAPGSGRYAVDTRLRAERIEQRSDERISEAWLSVRLDDGFDALAARERYGPDLRVVVRTEAVNPAQRVMLFEGYPVRQTSRRDGGPRNRKDEYVIQATSVYVRWAQDERAQIFGRRMRSAEIVDGLLANPAAYAGRSVHVEGLACVFNAEGIPNRAADPLAVVDSDGIARRIHVFTYDGDPAAQAWTFAEALRYLLWFHRPTADPVGARPVLDVTEAAVGAYSPGPAGALAPSMLLHRLRRRANHLEVEATNLVEALARLADDAGVHVTCMMENTNGGSRAVLRAWAAEDGATKEAPLAWGGRCADGARRYDAAVLPARDVFADNALQRVVLEWDHAAVVNAPLVIGDVKRWEATVELAPGWLPETLLDNVAPEDREAARLEALTPDQVDFLGPDAELVPWFRKYHRRGSEFAEHRDVGRLWVLNEDGAFDGASYNRNAPYHDYQPFDFASVIAAAAPGSWTRRPRPMEKTITPAEDGTALGVHVEVSYDSGATWHAAVGSVTVLKDRAGIWFGLVNPTAMIPPGGDWYATNLWYALIDQTFRVRATAVFADDARLVARASVDAAHTPTVHRNSRMVYQPRLYRFASRRGTVDALAAVNPSGDGVERDDAAAAQAVAARIAAEEGGGTIEATLAIPWLDGAFAIGDRVKGIRGRTVDFNGVLRTAGVRDADWAVVGKTLVLGGGKLETTLTLAHRSGST